MLEEILKPHFGALIAPDHRDLRHFRFNGDPARRGDHRRERTSGGLDWIDALTAYSPADRHGRAVAREATHFDLWVRGLLFELFGNDATHTFGCIACGFDPPGVWHEDKA